MLCAKFPFDLSILNHFLNSMSLTFALKTIENNKNKKSVKFQGDMLNFCDFIQCFFLCVCVCMCVCVCVCVRVFTTNHHLKRPTNTV